LIVLIFFRAASGNEYACIKQRVARRLTPVVATENNRGINCSTGCSTCGQHEVSSVRDGNILESSRIQSLKCEPDKESVVRQTSFKADQGVSRNSPQSYIKTLVVQEGNGTIPGQSPNVSCDKWL
jgi:hypothetical protein